MQPNKPKKPQQYKRPGLPYTQKVLELMREDDKEIGNLTPYHLKWLLMYTYTQFSVRSAVITLDFKSSPKKIYISPTRDGAPFGVTEWAKLKFVIKWQKVERDIARYIHLPNFQVEFRRLPVVSDQTIDAKDVFRNEENE